MLFYLKKHVLLELVVTTVLGGGGWIAIRYLGLPIVIAPSLEAVLAGVLGALGLALWTLLVQAGYAATMGRNYAQDLTAALATHFMNAQPLQVVAALFAAAGEEIFFRGFVLGRYGLVAGAVAFMIAHLGGRDIRVIGYWSIFQGLGLGACYAWSGNLVVPMLAHGLFDSGAMIHFRRLMAHRFAEAR